MDNYCEQVRKQFREWFKENPFTVRSVAKELGFHYMTVHYFLSGRRNLFYLSLQKVEFFIYTHKNAHAIEVERHEKRVRKARDRIAKILRSDYTQSLTSLARKMNVSHMTLVRLTHHKSASVKTLEILEKYLDN